jgi:HAD superfamily phosphatase (TIGR01681 family)
VARLGLSHFYDSRYWHIGRAPFTRQALREIAIEDFKFIRALKGKAKKCLVLDCDNTLWGGIVGEDGLTGIKLGQSYPGSAYYEFQQEILNLHHRGVILALCSKNNEEDVWEVFRRHPDMILREEHIATAQINWGDKAANLRRIAQDLNIGLDSLVFVDDSEFEVGEWEYQGIELYYKFYLLDQVPVSEKNYTTLTELQNNGFFRITSANDQSIIKPVLAINTGLAEFQGDVDFRIEMTNLQVTVDEPAPATVMVDQIRRGVRYDNSEPVYPYFRRFLWDDLEAIPQVGFAASHGDVNQELYDFMDDPVNTGFSITMVMYALSYGKQSGLLIDLHSDAVFLGEISINFGW